MKNDCQPRVDRGIIDKQSANHGHVNEMFCSAVFSTVPVIIGWVAFTSGVFRPRALRLPCLNHTIEKTNFLFRPISRVTFAWKNLTLIKSVFLGLPCFPQTFRGQGHARDLAVSVHVFHRLQRLGEERNGDFFHGREFFPPNTWVNWVFPQIAEDIGKVESFRDIGWETCLSLPKNYDNNNK